MRVSWFAMFAMFAKCRLPGIILGKPLMQQLYHNFPLMANFNILDNPSRSPCTFYLNQNTVPVAKSCVVCVLIRNRNSKQFQGKQPTARPYISLDTAASHTRHSPCFSSGKSPHIPNLPISQSTETQKGWLLQKTLTTI